MSDSMFLKDYLVSRMITFGKNVDGYGKAFYQTNEDLIDQYLDVDFKDKKVMSVLASGDQVFTSRYLEAKTTDAFDFNRLSIYYFYLRLWSIQYRKELYPKILEGDNKWLISLLKMVKPRNEQEQKALKFFKLHIKEDSEIDKLFYDVYAQPEGRTLFTKPEELSDCLSPELMFYQLDLFKEFYLSTTYDIALISNILEWARNDHKKMKIAHENLSRLMNKDGVVICSRIIYRSPQEEQQERSIFEDFDYEKTQSGYMYIKKNIR